MGRVSSVHRGNSASVAGACLSDASDRLRRHGALAGMAGNLDHGFRDLPASLQRHGDRLRQVTALLAPLHADPAALAARLMYRFGSIARVATASEAELRQVQLVGETWVDPFVTTRQLLHLAARECMIRSRLGHERKALEQFLVMTMGRLDEEQMLAIFADSAGFVICEEVLAAGGEAHVCVTQRKIFGRALNLDARKILLAHNHPSGDPNPSSSDIAHTRSLCLKAQDLGIVIEDHLIVTARGVVSMKDRGLI